MGKEEFEAVIIILIGLFPLYIGFFLFRKKVFLETDKFSVFRDILPLPVIVNFWIFKILMLFGGLLIIFLGFYFILTGN